MSMVVAASFFTADQVPHAQERSGVVVTSAGRSIESVSLVHGKSTPLEVSIDGRAGSAITEPVVWTAVPSGVVDLRDGGDGRVTVTPLRDVFDDPNAREPRVTLGVCVGRRCISANFVCTLSVAGNWKTHIAVSQLPITQDRDFAFTQDGRKFEHRKVQLRVDGTHMRLTNGGGLLSRLDGTFTSRNEVHGTWATTDGFSGTWSAIRNP